MCLLFFDAIFFFYRNSIQTNGAIYFNLKFFQAVVYFCVAMQFNLFSLLQDFFFQYKLAY